MLLFECFVHGRPPSKKNTKKVIRKYGKTIVLYSERFREWESHALVYLRQAFVGRETIEEPLEIKLVFYFRNRQQEADVSNLVEAPQDALEKAGIIKNDRLIQVVHARKVFDKFKEGMQIELYRVVG
jgi:Holliday junction resolvase RusA-like endonuclease